jgi:Flp pilus assembly protein CpaB
MSAKTWVVLLIALIVVIAVAGWVAAAFRWALSRPRGRGLQAAPGPARVNGLSSANVVATADPVVESR